MAEKMSDDEVTPVVAEQALRNHVETHRADWTMGGPNYFAWWEKYYELLKKYQEAAKKAGVTPVDSPMSATIETTYGPITVLDVSSAHPSVDPRMEEKWIEAEQGPLTMQEYLRQEREAGRLIRFGKDRNVRERFDAKNRSQQGQSGYGPMVS